MGTETIKQNEQATHKITLTGRQSMEILGVCDVISFDEQTVTLSTVAGGMEICGDQLHIHVLSMETGVVTLDGRVDSITYYESSQEEQNGNGGFFKKLFR